MRFLNQLKKIFVLLVAALSISIVSLSNASAQASSWELNLEIIAEKSTEILNYLSGQMTVYLNNIAIPLMSLVATDEGAPTSGLQGYFTTLGVLFNSEASGLLPNQRKLVAAMLDVPESDFDRPRRNPKILGVLPNVNELSYSTLLNSPPTQFGAKDKFNYIKNAAGIPINHPIPRESWDGKEDAKKRYKAYFETLTAVQSYNAYLLSKLEFEGNASIIQNYLVSQASAPTWMTSIASENMGKVFRQLLLFISQNYILNTQIQKNMKDIATAQAMTNSLLILFNQQYERQMVRSAKGLPPRA